MFFVAKLVKQLKENPRLSERMSDEIREATKLTVEGAKTCCVQIKSSGLSKFLQASKYADKVSGIQKGLNRMYQHINAALGVRLLDAKKDALPRPYPKEAVGLEDSVREVMDMLEWGSDDQHAVSVILSGFGGMGKTTLGDAVFSAEVRLFKDTDSKPDSDGIVKLQREILKDLTGSKDIEEFRTPEDGQRLLGSELEKVAALIYIDNALGADELAKLLPTGIDNAKKVRILMTTRDINVRGALSMETSPRLYRMRGLSYTQSMSLLKKVMSSTILTSEQVNHIIEKCGGIPLMLNLAVRALRFQKDERKVREIMEQVDNLEGMNFGDEINSYFFSYDALPEECKDPFLDISSFFRGWEWDMVANIVGWSNLDILEERALVTKVTSGNVDVATMHDVILQIGQKKTQGMRFKFTEASQLTKFLHNKKDFQSIKGIWLTDNHNPLVLSASNLDLMHSSLRVLALGDSTEVEGDCKEIFKNLIFFKATIPCLPFDVSMSEDLHYLSYEPAELNRDEMPRNLRFMELDGGTHSPSSAISFDGLRQLSKLQILRLLRFTWLRSFPTELGNLVELQELCLSGCRSIKELPEAISKLQSLRILRLENCNLRQLPKGFELLKSLHELNLQGCEDLEKLPDNIGRLKSLVKLDLTDCDALTSIVDDNRTEQKEYRFCKLSFITYLSLQRCWQLERLPDGFGKLASLKVLNLEGCSSLPELPKDFFQLKSLAELNLSGCDSLKELCINFHRLSLLRSLDLSCCSGLENLSQHFHRLASLQYLSLSASGKLERKWMDSVVKIKTLQTVDIRGTLLESRYEEIQGESHQSWPFMVLTDQGAKSDPDPKFRENMLKTVSLQLHSILIDRPGESRQLSELPTDTDLLVIFDCDQEFRHKFPWPLIEETINCKFIYIGNHFNKFPPKVVQGIVAHAPYNLDTRGLVDSIKALSLCDGQGTFIPAEDMDLTFGIMTRFVADGKGGKYLSCCDILSNLELEKFAFSKCERYLKLKRLAETPEDSNEKILRVLFADKEEEDDITSTDIFLMNYGEQQAGIDKLKGKTILLELRPAEVGLSKKEILLRSLIEMYISEKEELEIISIPIVEPSTRLSTIKQISTKFSREVPWLVLQNPRRITRAVKHFLVHCTLQRTDHMGSVSSETKYDSLVSESSIMSMIINPNGTTTAIKYEDVLSMADRWGTKACGFTHEKNEELKRAEWNQLKTMSSLEFLVMHLSDQVKEVVCQPKMICLYSCSSYDMEAYTGYISNALIDVKDNIQVIYTTQYQRGGRKHSMLADNVVGQTEHWKNDDMREAHMEGMSLFNLLEADSIKLWARTSYLLKEISDTNFQIGVNEINPNQQVDPMKRFLEFFSETFSASSARMMLIDEDGEMVMTCGEKDMEVLAQSKVKELMKLLIRSSKEERKQVLLKLEKSIEEEKPKVYVFSDDNPNACMIM